MSVPTIDRRKKPSLSWADMSQDCKFGTECVFLKAGKCHYLHADRNAPAKSGPSLQAHGKDLVLSTTSGAARRKNKVIAGKIKSLDPKVVNGFVTSASLLLKRRAELKAKALDFERKYVLVNEKDSKDTKVESPYADAMKLNENELSQLRATLRSIMGPMKVLKITLVENQYYASDGSGNCKSVLSVDPSTITEFSTLANLFDEYKVTGGEFRFGLLDWVPNSGAGVISHGVLAYDPADGTVPTSEITLAQKQQTMLVFYGTAVAGSTSLTITHPGGHTFPFKVPTGVLVPAGATASEGTSNWQPTGSSNGFQPYGWMKYCKQAVHASITQIGGLLAYHCEFRSRE